MAIQMGPFQDDLYTLATELAVLIGGKLNTKIY